VFAFFVDVPNHQGPDRHQKICQEHGAGRNAIGDIKGMKECKMAVPASKAAA
jgi:hypothetical protein